MSIRLIPAPITITFEAAGKNEAEFEREYHQLAGADEDPIGQWVKLAKARGETAESDPLLLNLLVELHRKIDNVERLIKNEEPERIALGNNARIESIGFNHFNLEAAVLKAGEEYYGRIEMPVYPQRDIGVYFVAESETLAKILKMHERDEKEWAAYLTARERIMIREMKGTE